MDKTFFSNTNPSIVSSNRVLYTPSSFAKSSLLHLQEIGELSALKAHTSSRSNLQSFLFFVVIKGSGTLIYDGKTYPLEEKSCVFINCKHPYSHTTDNTNIWPVSPHSWIPKRQKHQYSCGD